MAESAYTKGLTVGYPAGGITGPTSAAVGGPCCAGREWPYEIVTSGMETIGIFPAQEGGGIEEAKANAAIFAAAPDLAAEVEQCAIELEEAANVFDGSGYTGLARIYRGASERARAALSRALGKEG